jgi:hypothetical protein
MKEKGQSKKRAKGQLRFMPCCAMRPKSATSFPPHEPRMANAGYSFL